MLRAEVRVKGGLPLIAEADYVPAEYEDGFMKYGEGVENIKLMWPSGKEITEKVYNSISERDWEDIHEKLLDR